MNIRCEEKLAAAKQYANELGDNSLNECLARLEKYEQDGRVTNLGSDFAPHSFYFEVIRPDGSLFLNGGLLYHGSPDESFSVVLDYDESRRWRIHT